MEWEEHAIREYVALSGSLFRPERREDFANDDFLKTSLGSS